jgi:hypothetical protein
MTNPTTITPPMKKNQKDPIKSPIPTFLSAVSPGEEVMDSVPWIPKAADLVPRPTAPGRGF